MIHELRMYTLKPGTVNKVIEASGTVAQRIRGGAAYGKLESHWSSEIGLLNQYIHLWAYENLEEMRRLRDEALEPEAADLEIGGVGDRGEQGARTSTSRVRGQHVQVMRAGSADEFCSAGPATDSPGGRPRTALYRSLRSGAARRLTPLPIS